MVEWGVKLDFISKIVYALYIQNWRCAVVFRDYPTLQALRRGEVIDLEGLPLKMAEGELQEGDLYVAERNTEPKLLTVRKITYPEGLLFNKPWVVATTPDYSFDLDECVKVCEP